MRKALSIFIALTIGSVSHAAAQGNNCATNKPITVRIAKDGNVLWEATPMTYAEAMRHFSDAAKAKPMPNIRIAPDSMMRYDSFARLLSDVQRTGFHCFGIVGIDARR